MPNAFDRALRRLFADRNIGADATYAPPGGGAPVACRVVRRNADQAVSFGDSRPVGQAAFVDVLAADLAPARGGAFTIAGVGRGA